MAKFKVGDKVKVLDKTTLLTSQTKKIGKVLEVVAIHCTHDKTYGYYLSDCTDTTRCPLYFEDELELVEPKKEEQHDKAFDLNPNEFEKTKTPFSDIDDSIKYILKSIESPYIPLEYKILNGSVRGGKDMSMFNRFSHLFGNPTFNTKNRIPDRVVFNEAKGKVTVLMSKHLDGVAPYRAYTSKVNVESGDAFDAQFGFLLSYYKYLIRSLSGDVQKEMLDRIFKLVPSKRYAYLLGVVENEVLKIEGVKTYKDWLDIYMAITETPKTSLNVYNYTWDYIEWQEMLRVHELELKREKAREVRKQIKAHEKEIAKLKKEV